MKEFVIYQLHNFQNYIISFNSSFFRFVASLIALIVVYLIYRFCKKTFRHIQIRNNMDESRFIVMKRILTTGSYLLYAIVLSLIWSVNLHTLWMAVSGVLAMLAVAFVAVWSILANILGGIVLYFSRPFKIHDTIHIAPDDIRGRVVAINTIFTVLANEDGDFINVPNTLFFQKYVTLVRRRKYNPKEETS